MTVILFVLGTVELRIVGSDEDEPAIHTGVGEGHEGICSHIDSHMLHRCQRPCSCQGGSDDNLQGYLLIGGPL
jgi:hypothetical protein